MSGKKPSRAQKKNQNREAGSKEPNSKNIKTRDKRKYIDYKDKVKKGDPLPSFREDSIRLNKFLSNAGICSRREADVLIKAGVIKINGEIITELGYKINPDDKVQYDGETIRGETKRYVLLNKPKGFNSNIDSNHKKTVFSLIKKQQKNNYIRLLKWKKKQQV